MNVSRGWHLYVNVAEEPIVAVDNCNAATHHGLQELHDGKAIPRQR